MESGSTFVAAGWHPFAVAFVTALSLSGLAPAQTESGLPVFIGQPGAEAPRFEGRTDATTFAQWWYLHHETVLDLRRTVTGGVDARRGFRRVLESDYERVMIALEAAQADANPEVRAAAALALAKSQDRRGIANLLAEPAAGMPAPLFDANANVRRAAILGLGVGADAAALDTLRDILLDAKWEPELRATAALAIGLIEVPVETGAAEQPEPIAEEPAFEFTIVSELDATRGADLRAVTLDSKGERVVFGFGDGTLAFWSTKSSKLGKSWKAHAGEVTALEFLPDDDRVVSIGIDGVLRIDSLRLGKSVIEVPELGTAAALALTAAGDRIVVGCGDGSVAVIPTSGKKEFLRRFSVVGAVVAVAFARDDRAVAATSDGTIVRLGPTEKDPVETVASLGESVTSLAVDRSGERMLIGTAAGAVRCLRLIGIGEAAWNRELGSRVTQISAPRDSDSFAVSTESGALHFLAADTGELLATIDGDARRFSVDPTGLRLAIVGADGSVSRRDGAKAAKPPIAAPGGGAPARDPALSARRATVLSERLAEDAFLALDPLVRDGVALGAGLTNDPSLAPALERLLDSGAKKGISGPTLGHLAIAYGRLVAVGGGDVDRLVKLATDADSADVRRGAVVGLGAALTQPRGASAGSIVHALIQRRKLSSGESDRRVKNAISLALGRIGGAKAEAFLVSEFDERDEGPSIARVPGKVGFDELDAAPLEAIALATMRSDTGYELARRRYGKEGAIHFRGALAVSLGLFGPGANKANKELTADLRKEKNPVLVAHLALALGLARANGATDALEARFLDPKCDAAILPQLAVARAMLDVPGAAPTPALIVKRLKSAKSSVERAALAFALGLVGDPTAVDALLLLLREKDAPAQVRATVVAALGEMLDPGPFRRLPRALADLDGIEDPRLIATFAGE